MDMFVVSYVMSLVAICVAVGYALGSIVTAAPLQEKLDRVNKEATALRAAADYDRATIESLRSDTVILQHNYDAVHGLWATDRPDLVNRSALCRSIFYRIGYPGEKL